MSWGMKLVNIIIIISLCITQFPGLQRPYATCDLINESTLNGHSTIYINNNTSFTSANGVVSGNGTIFNPFIIENWSIDASLNHGIWIENTWNFREPIDRMIQTASENWDLTRISQVDYDGTVNIGPQTVVINDSKKHRT